MAKNYSAFEGLNLSDARMENETREEYKLRLKSNKKILKLYSKFGREAFQELFPEGIRYDMFKEPTEKTKEFSKEDAKKFIEEQQKHVEKLGEAK